jgi:hypothetical protein
VTERPVKERCAMSAQQDVKGFVITPAKAAFILTIIGIVTFAMRPFDYFKDLEFQVKAHAEYIAEDKENTKEILVEIKEISRKVTELGVIIRKDEHLLVPNDQ